MRIEQVQPDTNIGCERWASIHVVAASTTLVRTTLDAGGLLEKIIVVAIEASGQTRRCPQRITADECPGRVPARPQDVGERGHIRQLKPVIGANTMARGMQTGENRGVRGKRQRHLRDGGGETHRACGEAIQIRRETGSRSIRAETIRAQRVDGHEHDEARVLHRVVGHVGARARRHEKAGDRQQREHAAHGGTVYRNAVSTSEWKASYRYERCYALQFRIESLSSFSRSRSRRRAHARNPRPFSRQRTCSRCDRFAGGQPYTVSPTADGSLT